jgi:multiple sugar transport system permease protein
MKISQAITRVNPPTPIRWWQKYRNRNLVIAFLFVFPALLNFLLFRYLPIIWAARTSFYRYSFFRGFEGFVGLDHYIKIFTNDPEFINSLKVTLIFALTKVPIQVVLALALAVFAVRNIPGMGAMRAIIFIPVVTSFIVVSIVWGMMLNKDVGLVNAILQTVGLPRMEFLSSKANALPSIIMISIWKDVGYSVIVLVAAMKGISEVYYEVAMVLGANAWQQFINVTIPMLRRALMFVVVMGTLSAFQVFIPIYQLTRGGPRDTTNVIVYYIYKKAFQFGEMDYAAALSIVLLAIMLIFSLVQMRIMRSEEFE